MLENLKEIIKDKKGIIADADMSEHTSYKTGGRADYLAIPGNEEELISLIKFAENKKLQYIIIGNGSNILVRDGGFKGLVIKIGNNFADIIIEDNRVTAGAGALLAAVARSAAEKSLSGLEFACGIPGSIGGAIFMNAGAYGGEMKDVVESARVLSKETGEIKVFSVDDLDLSYRHSKLQETGDVVISATYKLEHGNVDEIKSKMAELMEKRNSKQPVNYPSCGSFFKRPEGDYAGRLIEASGFRGFQVGGAQVSELHCGFVINKKDAKASDIIELMHIVQAGVLKDSGTLLEPEVRIIGEE